MPTKEDKELLELLTKLYDIQETVGAKTKTSDADKRARAENSGMKMGKGRKAQKAGSRFLELKSSIVTRLKQIRTLLKEEAERTSGAGMLSVAQGNNPKEVIARQAQIREEIRQATDEWQELDGLYKNEARKKRSKFSQEELDFQQTLVQRLAAELENLKELQGKGYVNLGGKEDMATRLNTQTLNVTDFDGNDNWLDTPKAPVMGSNGAGNGVEMTHDQSLQLQQIDKRDAEFDQELDMIGEGISDLAEIALMQSEEVRRQNVMLDNVGDRIENVQEHMENINVKMKETLDEVRAADKICVDIMCIVVMVGLGAVMYNLGKGGF